MERLLVILLSLLIVLLGIGLCVGMVLYVWLDAQKKDVPNAGWWALGTLMTGPFGFIAYLVDRPATRVVTCWFCGETILDTDHRCPFCSRPRRNREDDAERQ